MEYNQSEIKLEQRHIDLRGWAAAAKFEEVTSRSLGTEDYFELRFKRGRNNECTTAAEVEKWLGYIVRGMGFRIPPGDCVVNLTGDQITTWFRWEPRPTAVEADSSHVRACLGTNPFGAG